MTTMEQIQASVANGLSRPKIEALLGRALTPEEIQTYNKSKAIYDLQLRKKRTERKYEHLSGAEIKRKHDDKVASIDSQLDSALEKIDWKRRRAAEADVEKFIDTYLVGYMMEDSPSPKMRELLHQMTSTILQNGQPLQLLVGRGAGKTTAALSVALWLLCSARKKFVVIVSQNHSSAQSLLRELGRVIMEPETPLAMDYPEVCLPFQLCGGAMRRRQLYRGLTTDLQKTATQLVFPRLGKAFPTSNSCVVCRGISSGVRGLRGPGGIRPDCVLLDDIQTAASADSSEQVEKLWNIVRQDILNLGAKNRMALICCATTLTQEDLTYKMASDKNWRTIKYPAIIKWPRDIVEHPDDGLWSKYFQIYHGENANEKPHTDSTEFYVVNRERMDEGAELFSPGRYNPEEHVSALQALLIQREIIGNRAFLAEFQQSPSRFTFALDITPRAVTKKAIDDSQVLEVPPGTVLICAASDQNLSYAVTTTITAFRADMSAHVLYHGIHKCNIDSRLPEAEYSAAVIRELTLVGKRICSLGIKIDGWAIDASGTPFDATCSFCRNSVRLCGLRAVAMVGRANHVYNPLVRSRLRDDINGTVLCGDPAEHLKAGSGKKWLVVNADKWRETAHKAILAPLGAAGTLTLYAGDGDEHAEFAAQIANERLVLVAHKKDGRDEYTWKTKEPHDYGDALAMCYALAANQGVSGQTVQESSIMSRRHQIQKLIRERRRIQIKCG